MPRSLAFVILMLAAGGIAFSDDVPTSPRPILKSIYRHEHLLTDFVSEDTEALACVFMSKDCPIAQQYIPRLMAMYHELNDIDPQTTSYDPYKERVRLLAVYSNAGDDVYEMARHAQALDYPFPALLDVEGRLAEQLGIRRTPEVVVFDHDLTIRYHGAIDDQYFKGGVKPKPRKHYLKDGLTSLIAGEKISPRETLAAGCLLEPHGRDSESADVSFYKDVLPVMQTHCQTCHRWGEVGPFPLVTYDDVADHAEMIREVVRERRMPPWPAESPRHFTKDVRLSVEQIAAIQSWVQGGLAKGRESDAPPAATWPEKRTWKIGEPEVVYEMPQAFTIPAAGLVEYQYYRFKTGFEEDRWVRGVEIQAGEPRVVHHLLVHQVPTGGGLGAFDMLELYGGLGASRTNTLVGDYSPGDDNAARKYSQDSGLRIRAGNDIVFEVHYTPIGTELADRSRMGLILADTAPQREIKSRLFLKPRGRFLIPKRHPHFRMQDTYWFETDVRILGVRPHMHLRAKNYKLDVVHPDEDERTEPILTIPIWDYFWHKTYMFEEPVVLKAGKELLATVVYDNSEFNPNNPDPDYETPWGQGTEHEMFNTFILYEELPPAAVDR